MFRFSLKHPLLGDFFTISSCVNNWKRRLYWKKYRATINHERILFDVLEIDIVNVVKIICS